MKIFLFTFSAHITSLRGDESKGFHWIQVLLLSLVYLSKKFGSISAWSSQKQELQLIVNTGGSNFMHFDALCACLQAQRDENRVKCDWPPYHLLPWIPTSWYCCVESLEVGEWQSLRCDQEPQEERLCTVLIQFSSRSQAPIISTPNWLQSRQ